MGEKLIFTAWLVLSTQRSLLRVRARELNEWVCNTDFMKIAIPVTDNMVSGPGEGLELRIYDTEKEIKLLDTYENPALTATSARGIWMLRSAIDRGAGAIILSGAGAPAFTFTKGKLKIYLGAGLSVDDALSSFRDGKLSELTTPTHEHGHHDHGEH